jgi:hypothetical protein
VFHDRAGATRDCETPAWITERCAPRREWGSPVCH